MEDRVDQVEGCREKGGGLHRVDVDGQGGRREAYARVSRDCSISEFPVRPPPSFSLGLVLSQTWSPSILTCNRSQLVILNSHPNSNTSPHLRNPYTTRSKISSHSSGEDQQNRHIYLATDSPVGHKPSCSPPISKGRPPSSRARRKRARAELERRERPVMRVKGN